MKGCVLQASIIMLGALLILGSGGPQYGGNSDDETDDTNTDTGSVPGAPSNVKAVSAYQGALLTWGAASNASSYELCYATESIDSYSACTSYNSGTIHTLGNVTSTAISSLTAGQPYHFRVVAKNNLGAAGTASADISVTPNQGMNDTGITVCRESGSTNVSCPSVLFPDQDADYGLDNGVTDSTNGHAGFSFIKLTEAGAVAAESASDWACVKDNITGLIWEVKLRTNGETVVGNDGLHDADDSFTWYSTNAVRNGGTQGSSNSASATCHGYDASDSSTYCNTEAFVARVNVEKYCGVSNWRLPSREELTSIINYDSVEPAIDLAIFPYTPSEVFWSSTTVFSDASSGAQAWSTNFNYGGSGKVDKTESHRVRLVSDGQ